MKSYIDTNRLYRDNVNRKVSGVCAGVAKHFGQEPWLVRVLTVACFVFLPVPTALAYVLGVLLIPSKDY
jgi:phage shock protein C